METGVRETPMPSSRHIRFIVQKEGATLVWVAEIAYRGKFIRAAIALLFRLGRREGLGNPIADLPGHLDHFPKMGRHLRIPLIGGLFHPLHIVAEMVFVVPMPVFEPFGQFGGEGQVRRRIVMVVIVPMQVVVGVVHCCPP
jgi:hypothetical protein